MAKAKKATFGPRAYSYLRFSTKEQALGDSERRQLEWARRLASQLPTPLHFDEELMADRGVSGHHGDHIKKGKLGIFLAKIESGDVAPGSVLIVERINRLSRQNPIDAIEVIIFGIIKKGVSIITRRGTYDVKSLNNRNIKKLIDEIQKAYDDSVEKSEWVGEAWEANRDEVRAGNRKLTKMIPIWLGLRLPNGDFIDDRNSKEWKYADTSTVKFEAISEAAETINYIYDLKLEGRSPEWIAKKLNDDGTWVLPRHSTRKTHGFNGDAVRKLLKNRALIGELQLYTKRNREIRPQGEPLKGYYSVVIELEKFDQVQRLIAKNRRHTGGPNLLVTNLFRSLTTCPYCGGPAYPVRKGGDRPYRLVCSNSKYHKSMCKAPGIRYDVVESLIFDNCPRLHVEDVLQSQSEQTKRAKDLERAVAAREEQISQLDKIVVNLRLANGLTSDPEEHTINNTRIDELKRDQRALQAQNNSDEEAIRLASTEAASFETWQGTMEDLRAKLHLPEIRFQLKAHLARYIERVDLFTRGKFSTDACYGPDCDLPESAVKFGTGSPGRRFVRAQDREGESLAQDIGFIASTKRSWNPKTKSGRREVLQSDRHPGTWLQAVAPANRKLFNEFLRDLEKRRLSRDGAFVRVWFRTGVRIDLVPAGSIGSGARIVKNPEHKKSRKATKTPEYIREPVGPDVEALWAQFQASRGVKTNCKKI